MLFEPAFAQALTLAYGVHFLLLTWGYLIVSSPRVNLNWGITIEILSLAPVALVVAAYFSSFVGLLAFLQENMLARLVLTGITFVVLLSIFSRINGSEGFLMALAASVVGSVFIFMLAASGGIALAFIMLHSFTVSAVHTRALRVRFRNTARSIRRALECLKTLREIIEAMEAQNLIVKMMEFCAAQLEGAHEDTAVRIAKELRREVARVRKQGVTPDLHGRITAWEEEIEQLLGGVEV